MDAIDAIRTRRSIRSYKPRPVGRDLIETIILDAACAPPPFSGQVPWTFHVVEGVARIANYGEQAMRYAREHRPDGPGWDWVDRPSLPGFKVFWDAPALVIISGRVEDCCRAGQNLMLSAHARGLGSCWVGAPMLWLRSEEAKRELGIAEDLTPISVICLGYPEELPPAPASARPKIIWA